MPETLSQSLWITLISMGLVFASLLLLAGLMSLMTYVFRDKEEAASDSSAAVPTSDNDEVAQAAAIAVAVALAQQGQSTARPLPTPPTALVSAWQLGMRTRQMTQKGELGKRGK
jgi:sodium pump decarboxylase gamma subunit